MPPVPVAVNVTGVPAPAEVGPATVTASVNGLMTIKADPVAVFVLASVITTDTVKEPLVAYVVVKLDPVPEAGLPPAAVHANVYGVVPPEPAAVKVTAVPTVPVVGPATATASASAATVIVAVTVAV